MQVQISDKAAESIERLINDGSYEDVSDAVESAIRLLTESAEDYIEDVRAKILKSIESLDAGRGTLLTRTSQRKSSAKAGNGLGRAARQVSARHHQ